MENTKEEIWKDVHGYEGLYQVSTLGEIRSYNREWYCGPSGNSLIVRKGKILTPQVKSGYRTVNLYDANRKMKTKTIHRLVAIAFIEQVEDKNFVNHKDFDKKNNHVSNLEWCTAKENAQHAYPYCKDKYLSQLKKINDSGMNKKVVEQFDILGNKINEYESMSKASIAMCGKVSSAITNHINKAKKAGKTAYGYIWSYKTT